MCYKPIRAMSQETGPPLLNPEGDLLIPCGKCYECISKRASDWALRCQHEISLHKQNSFLTLTYDENNVPDFAERKDEFKKFMKRLRRRIKKKISYIVSHEFGSSTARIHHHAIIFGYDYPDQKYFKTTKSDSRIYTSEILDSDWKNGFSSIGEANAKTAYYIAAYALKGNSVDKLSSDGEIITYKDCMDVSKRPAIGLEYLKKNYKQLIDSKTTLPRYYQKKLEELYPDEYDRYKSNLIINPRPIYNRYAKSVIDESKNNIESEFRINSNNNDHQYRVDDLKSDYLMYNQKEKQKC